jgi:hypothetical protein
MTDKDSVVDDSERRYLTNELRKIALEELPPEKGYTVMTRENLFALIPPDKSLEECATGQCLVDLGRNVGAEYAAQGTVSKFGNLFTITVECYETMGGGLIGSFTAESRTVEDLLPAMREKAPQVFSKIRGIKKNQPSKEVKPTIKQTETKPKEERSVLSIRIGPIFDIGLNMAWKVFDNINNSSSVYPRLAFGGGFSFEFKKGKWKIVPEILLDYQKLAYSNEILGWNQEFSALALNIPVLIKHSLFNHIDVLFGPQLYIGISNGDYEHIPKYSGAAVAGLGFFFDSFDFTLRYSANFSQNILLDNYDVDGRPILGIGLKSASILMTAGYYF